MRRPPDEQVLVFERERLDDLGWFDGLTTRWEPYTSRLFEPGSCHFMDRLAAEEDERFKQVIAYVIVEHAGRYLFYMRSGRTGEQRLADRGSIGVGGHVSALDVSLFDTDGLEAACAKAAAREVAEEIDVGSAHVRETLGVINDDRDPVGRVHFGIVELWRLSAPLVERREQNLRQLRFATPQEILELGVQLESWSTLCLEHLATEDGDGRA